MYYYIKTVLNDDQIVIANTLEEKTINITDLVGTKDTIIGYNKITHAVKVSSQEEMIKCYNSKCKLVGREDLVYNDLVGIPCFSFEVVDTQTVRVVIDTTKIQSYEVFPKLLINYDTIFSELRDFCFNITNISILGEVNAELYYNLSVEGLALEFSPYPISDTDYTGFAINVTKIEFSPDTDINKLKSFKGMFGYADIDLSDTSTLATYNFTYTSSDIRFMRVEYNLGGLKINRQFNLDGLFRGFIPNYTGYEFIGEMKEQQIVKEPCIMSFSDMTSIENIFKSYGTDFEISDKIILMDTTYLCNMKQLNCDVRVLNCFGLQADSSVDLSRIQCISVIDNYVCFYDDVFSFVSNLSDETMNAMKKFISGHVYGTLESHERLLRNANTVFLEKFGTEIEKAKGMDLCNFLIKLSIDRDTDIIFNDELRDYDKKEAELILLLMTLLINSEDLEFSGLDYIADGSFENYKIGSN